MDKSADCTFRLDAQAATRLAELAHRRNVGTERLAQEAIAEYLDRAERLEAVRQDTLAAWSEFEATGLYATDEEADAWLARLENGEDAEPPASHS
jgi:predicted transcriptional regulator